MARTSCSKTGSPSKRTIPAMPHTKEISDRLQCDEISWSDLLLKSGSGDAHATTGGSRREETEGSGGEVTESSKRGGGSDHPPRCRYHNPPIDGVHDRP